MWAKGGELMSAKMIGPRLKELRQSMKLSQWKMAELLCVSQSSIDRYERNTARPTAENFLVYADYFDVSLDYIFGRCDDPQGKLYEYRPHVEESNPDLKLFVDMCFDPASPMSERLKAVLTKMLEETEKEK
jgi:Predicted transcriptional regulators